MEDDIGGNVELDVAVDSSRYGEEAITVQVAEAAGSKRGREDAAAGAPATKKAKKKKKKKPRPDVIGIVAATASFAPELQGEFWQRILALSRPALAADKGGHVYTGANFVDLQEIPAPREIKALKAVLKKCFPDEQVLRARKKWKPGQPRCVVVSPSAAGVIEFNKGLTALYNPQSGVRVAKLFARHIKLAEQMEQLQGTKVSVAVGTPSRIAQLAAGKALDFSETQVLLVDVRLNVKQQTIFNIKDTREALFSLFAETALLTNLVAGKARIAFF